MAILQAVVDWLREQGYGEIIASQGVGGGCINNGTRLETSSGERFFLKTNAQAPVDMFEREAEGLEAMRVIGGPRIPQVYAYSSLYLLLEDLAPGKRHKDYWRIFGRQLAAMHLVTDKTFGFAHDNYIGSTPQPNPQLTDGYQFFAEQRLNFQAELAGRRGLLKAGEVAQVARLAQRLPELVPQQPASLIHGDLWSGNAISGPLGEPALIDPAAHYGWAEAELGMTRLFGSFDRQFYEGYEEVNPLEKGWRERMDIYSLYHLINHLNLFGRGYYGQVMQVVRRYAV